MNFQRIAVLTALALVGTSVSASAQMVNMPATQYNYSPIAQHSVPLLPIGLWDKPNEACMTKCQVFVRKGCFTRLSKKHPAADPGSIQDQCDDKYSVCLYDCMCDTCDENQIIIKQP